MKRGLGQTNKELLLMSRDIMIARARSSAVVGAEADITTGFSVLADARVVDSTPLDPIVFALTEEALDRLYDSFMDDPVFPFDCTAVEWDGVTSDGTVFSLCVVVGAYARRVRYFDGHDVSSPPHEFFCRSFRAVLHNDNRLKVGYEGGILSVVPSEGRAQWTSTYDEDHQRALRQRFAGAVCRLELLRSRQVQLAPPPRHIRRAAQREGRAVDWHTVHIDPVVVRRLASLPRAALGETQLRLHMVRGHEADYTSGKGLFGKHKVKVKVREHWRGDPERGILFTDKWVIQAPK